MNRLAVIMAGGSGTRFWPKSSRKNPKQFLTLVGKKSMIRLTKDRVAPLVGSKNVSVVSPGEFSTKIKAHLGRATKIITEPEPRNTMAAVCLAAWSAKSDDSVMAILPADAHIGNVKEFQRALELCFEAAENQDIIVCLGIKPTFSATGFGYIKVGPHLSQDLYKIDSFVEKPNSEKAEEFFRGGQHLWNAGIFVFKISTFKNQVQQHAHDFFKFFNKTSLKAVGFKKQFKKLPKLPVDVALMEKTKSGALVVGDFGWNDLGSWPALAEVLPLNRDESLIQSSGGEFSLKSSKNIVHLESKKFLALIGIKNLIIVETPQAILVADQSHAQDIKEVVSHLQSKKKYSKLL